MGPYAACDLTCCHWWHRLPGRRAARECGLMHAQVLHFCPLLCCSIFPFFASSQETMGPYVTCDLTCYTSGVRFLASVWRENVGLTRAWWVLPLCVPCCGIVT